MCGAAALWMVFRSFSILSSQENIWPNISVPDTQGRRFAKTYRICAYALKQNLAAIALKAKDPIQVLNLCHKHSIRVILNHRLNRSSSEGHYTVLVDITDKHVTINDPQYGEGRKYSFGKLLELWQPLPDVPHNEITGNFLIAISNTTQNQTACVTCHTGIPLDTLCPHCHNSIPLRPAAALGCVVNTCPEQTWLAIDCPYCDKLISEVP